MMQSQTLFRIRYQDKLKYTADHWINVQEALGTTRLLIDFRAANHLDKLHSKLYFLLRRTNMFASYGKKKIVPIF